MEGQSTTPQTPQGVTFKEYVNECRHHRLWFAGCVVALMAAAGLFLLWKQPLYERSAQVMIKEDSSPSSKLTAGLSMIQGMGALFGGSSNVSNELLAMETTANVMETVKRLHMDYEYSVRPFIRKETLYGEDLPISVSVASLKDDDGAYMKVKLDHGKVTLYKMRRNKQKFKGEYSGHINQVFKTPMGDVTVNASQYYKGDEEMTIRVMHAPLIRTTKKCQESMEAGITEELGSVIDLTYKDAVPQRAVDFLNTLIQIYNEQWMADENQLNTTTTQFLDNRLTDIVDELARVESEITDYKSQNKLPDIVETTKLAMKTSAELSGDLALLRGQKESARFVLDYMKNDAHENQTLPVNLLSNDKVLSAQITEFNTLQLQRNSLAENSNATNPVVQGMDKQLASLRSSIQAALTNTIAQTNIQIAGLERLVNTNVSKVESMPENAKYLLSSERQRKIQEQLYIFMLQKREENVLSQAFTPYKTRILSPPLGDIKPVEPKVAVVLILAFLAGLLLPALTILLRLNVRSLLAE